MPPILVNRRTMEVIDGTHRLLAAIVRGQESIQAIFFEGSPEEAFLWAVQANTTHGLPLSQTDRRSAAARIIHSHPHLSDRAIARIAGLGARSVAAVRRSSEGTIPQVQSRVGRDGKVRPINGDEGRRRAAEIIETRPEASLREIARLAGVSPATVSDVRRRLAAGESPALSEPGPAQDANGSVKEAGETVGRADDPAKTAGHGDDAEQARPDTDAPTGRPRRERLARLIRRDPGNLLRTLVRDPSLRHKEEGRHLLRLLQHNAIGPEELSELTSAVPAHCGELVADIAKQYGETWLEFAAEIDRRSS